MPRRKTLARKLNGTKSYINGKRADINRNIIRTSETSQVRRSLLDNRKDKYNIY